MNYYATNMHQQYRHASQQAYYRSLIIVPLPLGVGFTFVPVPVKAGVLAVSSDVVAIPVPAPGGVPVPEESVVPIPVVGVVPGDVGVVGVIVVVPPWGMGVVPAGGIGGGAA